MLESWRAKVRIRACRLARCLGGRLSDNYLHLAEALEIKVLEYEPHTLMAPHGLAEIRDGVKIVLLNLADSPEWKRYTLLREFYELTYHFAPAYRQLKFMNLNPESAGLEADLFCREVLMPKQEVEKARQEGQDPREIAARLCVPTEAVVLRLAELDQDIFDDGSLNFKNRVYA